MKNPFLTSITAIGLLAVTIGLQGHATAQAVREPTIDERFRDENVRPARVELPQLQPPQNAPSRLARTKAEDPKSAHSAYLGVTFGSGLEAIVRTVTPGSPAEQMGLKPNDRIETLQGRRIRTNDDVIDIVSKMKPGDTLDIGFSRRLTIRAQAPLAEIPTAVTRRAGYPPDMPVSNEAAPEDPQKPAAPNLPPTRTADQKNGSSTSSNQRRTNNSSNNSSDDNRRLFGRGLRGR